MSATGTDLIVHGAESPYAVMQMQSTELQELITDSLAPGETIGVRDLPRIKTPAGGAVHWSVPSLDGETAVKEVRGILLHVGNRRAYWAKKYDGSNDPPDCASDDGLVGKGDPGGPCGECPLNEWGEDGEAKACSEIRQLFLLPVDGILPYVINVKPGSLKNARQYFHGLLNARVPRIAVETVLSLAKTKNVGGIDYSQVVFRKGADLSPEAREHVKGYAAVLTPFLTGVPVERNGGDS